MIEKNYSPLDNSPEAILSRREKRDAYIETPEGQLARNLGALDRAMAKNDQDRAEEAAHLKSEQDSGNKPIEVRETIFAGLFKTVTRIFKGK